VTTAGPDRPVALADLTRTQAQAVAAAGAVVMLPIGATEQHGPHLPLATDTLHVESVARAAASELSARFPVVVAPALPYGCSQHHLSFGATASLSSVTLLSVLADLGSSLAVSGFQRIFLVNGHGGNHHLMAQSAQDLALRHDVAVGAASWWHLAADELVAAGALTHGNMPGHAGAFETALLLALRPELVRDPPAREPVPGRYSFDDPLTSALPGSWQGIDGWSDNPAAATAADGRDFHAIGVRGLSTAVERFATASGLSPIGAEEQG
jgi:creatinine amidohydrolase